MYPNTTGYLSNTSSRLMGSTPMRYPSPFFDIASTWYPRTVRELLQYCRVYFYTQPLIAATITKLSRYPVTDVVVTHESPAVAHQWEWYLREHLRLRSFLIGAHLDKNVCGNCVEKHTNVVTRDGVRQIHELAGKTVDTLSTGGVYRSTQFRSYGKQKLFEIKLGDGESLFATADHEWPVVDTNQKRRRVRTTELKGKRLLRIVAPRPPKDEDYRTGVLHGIVFGDGHRTNRGRPGVRSGVVFCANGKKQCLAKLFRGCASSIHKNAQGDITVYGMPGSFKDPPDKDASAGYWYGFVSGLLATDGWITSRNDQVGLCQTKRMILDMISARLPWLGMLGGPVRWETTIGYAGTTGVYQLSLKIGRMQRGDFIRPDQRKAFSGRRKARKYGLLSQVLAVVPTGRVEEVFCGYEPETHNFVIGNGILTGNCFISLIFPFIRQLTCTSCGHQIGAQAGMDHWLYSGGRFTLDCPKCQHRAPAAVRDIPLMSAKGIKLHRWDPMDVVIDDGDYPGTTRYLYRVPRILANAIRLGKKNVVTRVPLDFLDAVEQSKMVVFDQTNFVHVKRQTLSGKHKGWGMPLIAPVLKYAFYLQIMMKAQETVLTELMVPFRILFPQATNATSDPYGSVWLETWKRKIESEVRRWRADNCVHPDTWVESAGGLVRARDVRTGMLLRTHLGRFRKVLATSSRDLRAGERTCHIVAGGLYATDSVFSEDHPVWARRMGGTGKPLSAPAFVPIKDLQVGDYVGYPRQRENSKLDTLDLKSFVTCAVTDQWIYPDHPSREAPVLYELLSRFGKGTKGRAEALRKLRDEVPYTQGQHTIALLGVHRKTVRRFPRYLRINGEFAWVVGLYLAEGHTDAFGVWFSLHKREMPFARRLAAFFRSRFGASTKTYQHGENGMKVHVGSKQAADLFRSLCPGKARTKGIPLLFRTADDGLVASLLRGLFDGDGCWHHSGKADKITLRSASLQLAEGARSLLVSLGFPASIVRIGPADSTMKDGKIIHSGECYDVSVRGSGKDLLQRLWNSKACPVRPRRTSRIGFMEGVWFWSKIRKIAIVEGVEELLDFSVEEDHSFCTWGIAVSNSYIAVMPLPIGHQTIGGEGRSLLLGGEIRMLIEQIIAALEVPLEFVFAGTSYSASMVALRQLENLCLSDVEDDRDLLRWIVDCSSAYMKWPKPDDVHFKPFKSADDLARKQFFLALAQAGRVSGHTVCSLNDLDYDAELEMIKAEAKKEAEIHKLRAQMATTAQGEAGIVQARYQVKAQAAAQQQMKGLQQGPMMGMTPPGGVGGIQDIEQPTPDMEDIVMPGSPLSDTGISVQLAPDQQHLEVSGPITDTVHGIARKISIQVSKMDPVQQQNYLQAMQAKHPQLHGIITQLLAEKQSGGRQDQQAPLPDQLPPRRVDTPI